MTEVFVLLQWIVGNDFHGIHWLRFCHEVSFCLCLRREDDAITRYVFHGVIRTLDEENFRFGVQFSHGEGAVDSQGEFMYRVVVFPFDPKINLISRFIFFVVLSSKSVEVAFLAFLSRFESGLGVRNSFCEPLFPCLLKM